LRAEVELLKRSGAAINGNTNTLAQALWCDIGSPRSAANRRALWALDLFHSGRAPHLQRAELDFLDQMSRRRSLTAKQEDWLRDIVREMAARTGEMQPP
jgi:hypothetical protein